MSIPDPIELMESRDEREAAYVEETARALGWESPAKAEGLRSAVRALLHVVEPLIGVARLREADKNLKALADKTLPAVEAITKLMRAEDDRGTPTARWEVLVEELEKRFPNPEPHRSDRMSEEHYLAMIDALIAREARSVSHDTLCESLRPFPGSTRAPCSCGATARPKLAIMFSEPRTLICEATPEALCIAEAEGDTRAEREANARRIVAAVNETTK